MVSTNKRHVLVEIKYDLEFETESMHSPYWGLYGVIHARAEAKKMRQWYIETGHSARDASDLTLQWLSRQRMSDY